MTDDEFNSTAQAIVFAAAERAGLTNDIAALLRVNTTRDGDLPNQRMIAVLTEALTGVLENYYFDPDDDVDMQTLADTARARNAVAQ